MYIICCTLVAVHIQYTHIHINGINKQRELEIERKKKRGGRRRKRRGGGRGRKRAWCVSSGTALWNVILTCFCSLHMNTNIVIWKNKILADKCQILQTKSELKWLCYIKPIWLKLFSSHMINMINIINMILL